VSEETYRNALQEYYRELRKAQTGCWNEFLANTRGAEVFRANRYCKQRQLGKLPSLRTESGQPAISFTEKCEVFLKGLFPEPPSSAPIQWNGYLPSRTYDWPEITRVEIKRAIFSSSTKITPGPDRLSYRILREAYTAVPELFDFLYPILIGNGYHPRCWKEATGVIL
jgi:hypothetical protein